MTEVALNDVAGEAQADLIATCAHDFRVGRSFAWFVVSPPPPWRLIGPYRAFLLLVKKKRGNTTHQEVNGLRQHPS